MTKRSEITIEFLQFEGDVDAEKRRLRQMAQSGSEPQIFDLQIHTITYESSHIISLP